MLYQITSTYFTAGFITKAGKVAVAAPIIRYMQQWTLEKVEAYVKQKQWKLVSVES